MPYSDPTGFPMPEYHEPMCGVSDKVKLEQWYRKHGTLHPDLIAFRRLAVSVVLQAVRSNTDPDDPMLNMWMKIAGLDEDQTNNLIARLKSRQPRRNIQL